MEPGPSPQLWETWRPSWASPLLSGPLRGRRPEGLQSPSPSRSQLHSQPLAQGPWRGRGSGVEEGRLAPTALMWEGVCLGQQVEGAVGTPWEAHAPRAPSAARPGLFLREEALGWWSPACRIQVAHHAWQEMVNPLPDQRPLHQHFPKNAAEEP